MRNEFPGLRAVEEAQSQGSRRNNRLPLWSLVVFVVLVSLPGWYILLRLAENQRKIDKRLEVIENRLEADGEGTDDSP